MHALSYHVPVLIKNHKTFKQFTGQGVEKNSDDAKRIFFQKSNKWDAAKDALQLEVQQQALHHCEREKRKYNKQNNEHWDSGIVKSLLKYQLQIMKKMAVKQFVQEIKSQNLQVNGKSKLKKGQLIGQHLGQIHQSNTTATFVEAILGLLKCKSTRISFTASIHVDHDIVRYIFRNKGTIIIIIIIIGPDNYYYVI
ncbi:unnamed protein product [Pocillopora meandrina]|uniref:Uncharacterized protein n=1 Tax=Pocillopora meandrina TaxID=46732 RepID=A0AAU9XGX9_9CNID|nr:unnamed protein product [Pocillopora meandrina]